MSIKLKHLCLAHKKHPDQAHLWRLQKEEINTFPPKADGNQEVFDFTPSLFSIKEAWILTQARWFFAGALAHHLLSLLAFRIKLLFHAPTTCLSIIGLSLNKPYEIWLGNIYVNPILLIYPSSEMTAISVSSCLFFFLFLPYSLNFFTLSPFSFLFLLCTASVPSSSSLSSYQGKPQEIQHPVPSPHDKAYPFYFTGLPFRISGLRLAIDNVWSVSWCAGI